MKVLELEVTPFWTWFIIAAFEFFVYFYYGFEMAVISTLLVILWDRMVNEKWTLMILDSGFQLKFGIPQQAERQK